MLSVIVCRVVSVSGVRVCSGMTLVSLGLRLHCYFYLFTRFICSVVLCYLWFCKVIRGVVLSLCQSFLHNSGTVLAFPPFSNYMLPLTLHPGSEPNFALFFTVHYNLDYV